MSPGLPGHVEHVGVGREVEDRDAGVDRVPDGLGLRGVDLLAGVRPPAPSRNIFATPTTRHVTHVTRKAICFYAKIRLSFRYRSRCLQSKGDRVYFSASVTFKLKFACTFFSLYP